MYSNNIKHIMTTTFITSIILISVFMIGLSVKILFKKDGEFAGTCASQNPYLNKEGEACGLCGAMPEEKCKNEEI